MEQEFEVRDVIQLKSGSVPMTIIKTYDDGSVDVKWWRETQGDFISTQNLPAGTFKLVGKGSDIAEETLKTGDLVIPIADALLRNPHAEIFVVSRENYLPNLTSRNEETSKYVEVKHYSTEHGLKTYNQPKEMFAKIADDAVIPNFFVRYKEL